MLVKEIVNDMRQHLTGSAQRGAMQAMLNEYPHANKKKSMKLRMAGKLYAGFCLGHTRRYESNIKSDRAQKSES